MNLDRSGFNPQNAHIRIGQGIRLFRVPAALAVLLGFLILSPTHADESWEFSAVQLDAGGEIGVPNLAIHWTGPLPIDLVVGTVDDEGVFAQACCSQRITNVMSRIALPELTADQHLAVLGDSNEVLARTQATLPEFGWRSDFVGPGVKGEVNAVLEYQGQLIVAGRPGLSAGGLLGPAIVRWDGANWLPFEVDGVVPEFNGAINELIEYQGQLFVAGEFTRIGDQGFYHIARWDGSRWLPLGDSESNGVGQSTNDSVVALEVHNGELFVGGRFSAAAGIQANSIARWNGTSWRSLGSGAENGVGPITSPWRGPVVREMVSYGDELLLAGNFSFAGTLATTELVRWSNGAWIEVPGLNEPWVEGGINAMEVHEQKVFMAGEFLFEVGPLIWDGSSLETLSNSACAGFNRCEEDFRELTVFQGELYGIGSFSTRRLPSLDRRSAVARWQGGRWVYVHTSDRILGGGITPTGRAATIFNGQLFIGGSVPILSDTTRLNGLASYDGASWHTVPAAGGTGIPDREISDAVIWNDELIIGGSFPWAGKSRVNGIARWDGQAWYPIEGPSGVKTRLVGSLKVIDDELFALGQIVDADGQGIGELARFDSIDWTIVEGGVDQGSIQEIAVWQNQLIAAIGESDGFTRYVKTFDGQDWTAIPSDASGAFSGPIYDFEIHAGELYVAGDFSSISGRPIQRIARFDGNDWQALSSDPLEQPSDDVYDMLSYQNELWVGGRFRSIGDTDSEYLARWDGQVWRPVDNPVSRFSRISRLHVWNEQLVASGDFGDNRSLARYTDAGWAYFEGPDVEAPTPSATRIQRWRGRDYFVGGFFTAGGVPAWRIAEFVPEPASASIVSIDFNSWPPQPNSPLVTVKVSGLLSGPTSGRVTLVSDRGESSTDCVAQSVVELVRTYRCQIDFQGGGPRVLTAYFGASNTHDDAQSDGFNTSARWPSTVEIVETIPASQQTVGQPFEVIVEVNSAGSPTGEIVVQAERYDNHCTITLPDDRCTLIYFEMREIEVTADYIGDALNQPGSSEIDYLLVRGDLSFSPQPVEFGSLAIGQTSDPTVMSIRNLSGTRLTISSIGLPAQPFTELPVGSCRPLPLVLEYGENCTLHYQFTPLTRDHNSSLIIHSTASDAPHVIYLGGSGIDAIFKDAFRW